VVNLCGHMCCKIYRSLHFEHSHATFFVNRIWDLRWVSVYNRAADAYNMKRRSKASTLSGSYALTQVINESVKE
jgi:hypothetical protein